jgi:hypothetical protein
MCQLAKQLHCWRVGGKGGVNAVVVDLEMLLNHMDRLLAQNAERPFNARGMIGKPVPMPVAKVH